MKIILMRHGKPIVTQHAWIAPSAMPGWIAHYDAAEIRLDAIAPEHGLLAHTASHIIASTLARSLTSVAALGQTPTCTDSLFCEAQLPSCDWHWPSLPPSAWTLIFRTLWLCGYSGTVESLAAANIRAHAASKKLIALAETGNVLLVGHGIMNRLIAKQLRRAGWKAATRQGSQYWSATEFTLEPNRTSLNT